MSMLQVVDRRDDMRRQSLVELIGAFSKAAVVDPLYREENTRQIYEVLGERLSRIEKFIDGVEETERYLAACAADRQGN